MQKSRGQEFPGTEHRKRLEITNRYSSEATHTRQTALPARSYRCLADPSPGHSAAPGILWRWIPGKAQGREQL